MKSILLSLLLLSLPFHLRADEAPSLWTPDLPAALAQAGKEHRLVLVLFTGSDWCVWCHRLRDEILTKDHFLNYAKENLVLAVIDFPREKPLPQAQQEQNFALAQKFSVTIYPTLLVLNQAGEEVGRMAYMQGGPKTFVRELRRIAQKTKSEPASK